LRRQRDRSTGGVLLEKGATFQLPINSFGPYAVEVQVGTLMTSGEIEVVMQQSTCP
jgi:hypothetical protein